MAGAGDARDAAKTEEERYGVRLDSDRKAADKDFFVPKM